MSTNRPLPTNTTLTAIAIGYRNHAVEMIHSKALPPVPVLSERFTWLEYPIAQSFTVPEMQVGRKGRVNEVEFSAVEHESNTKDYGLDDVIPISDLNEAQVARDAKRSTYNPESAAVEGLTNLIMLGREIRAAKLIQDKSNFADDRRKTLTAAQKFSKFDTSDPFPILNEAMGKLLVYRANTIVMGQNVWETVKRHPKLIKAVKGGMTEDGAISRQQFAELMEIDPKSLLIGVSVVNASAKGQPINLVNVWGNSIQMLYVDPTKNAANDNVLTWGFTAELGSRMAGSIPAPEVGLEGGHRIRVGEKVREVVCAKDLGYMIEEPI